MRILTLWFSLLLMVLVGCAKADDDKGFSARYKGVFVRTTGSPLYDPMAASITLNFTENTFSGTSDAPKYSAICSGTFTISQTKITIHNKCIFTADFDWTYIFKGEYNYEQNGDELRIWRTYANGYTDIYQLTKEN